MMYGIYVQQLAHTPLPLCLPRQQRLNPPIASLLNPVFNTFLPVSTLTCLPQLSRRPLFILSVPSPAFRIPIGWSFRSLPLCSATLFFNHQDGHFRKHDNLKTAEPSYDESTNQYRIESMERRNDGRQLGDEFRELYSIHVVGSPSLCSTHKHNNATFPTQAVWDIFQQTKQSMSNGGDEIAVANTQRNGVDRDSWYVFVFFYPCPTQTNAVSAIRTNGLQRRQLLA